MTSTFFFCCVKQLKIRLGFSRVGITTDDGLEESHEVIEVIFSEELIAANSGEAVANQIATDLINRIKLLKKYKNIAFFCILG